MEELDWSRLMDDLLEGMIITQTDLAAKCEVTQQSISNWKNGIRSPAGFAREKIYELLDDASLSKDEYVLKDGICSKKKLRKVNPKLPGDVLKFAMKLSLSPKRKRTEAIKLAEFILDRK
jgi:transcriptional regulator with XRE-family HTH domain